MNQYCVYIMTNQSRTLYIGVTNDLENRVLQHRSRQIPGFTSKYNCTQLAWYETFSEIHQAIECEKRLKGWTRAKKIALIEKGNPRWEDLSAGWFGAAAAQPDSSRSTAALKVEGEKRSSWGIPKDLGTSRAQPDPSRSTVQDDTGAFIRRG